MGKAKDGSECYTRQNKSGGSYVTCEGTQKARKSASKAKSTAAKPKQKKPIPPNSARAKGRRIAAARKLTRRPPGRIETGSLNPGSVITDFDTSAFVSEAPGVVGMTTNMSSLGRATFDALLGAGFDVSAGISAAVEARKPTPAELRAREYREQFESRFKIGDKVTFKSGRNETAKVTAGVIEGFTDKGVVMRADKGKVEKQVNTGFNFSVVFYWRPTGGTQKKVVAWSRVRGAQEYDGRNVFIGRVGG